MGYSKEIFMQEREYDDINAEHLGYEQEPEEMPITEHQRHTIYKLLQDAILSPDDKEGIRRALDCKISYDDAEDIKQELKKIQLDPLTKYNPYVDEVNVALHKLVQRPNN